LERLHGTEGFVKSKVQGTDLQCAEENNGSRLKSTTGINYNPKIPYLETKAGDQTRNIKMVAYIKLVVFILKISTMYKEKSCLYKAHQLHSYAHHKQVQSSMKLIRISKLHTHAFPLCSSNRKLHRNKQIDRSNIRVTASGHCIH
jgi:hypothetical protein